MPPKAKNAEALALAAAMLRELETLRQRGGEAYPPRLMQLAGLTSGFPTDDEVQKSAAKTAFTAKAVVTEKVNRKPSLDALVYFKEDAPAKKTVRKPAPPRKPKDDGAELAGKMLHVLEGQRRLGADAYPPTLRRLAEFCDVNESDARLTKAVGHKSLTESAVVAAKVKGKPSLDAPVVLWVDIEGEITGALPALLRFALTAVTGGGKGKAKGVVTESTAFTPAEVKGKFVPDLQKPVLSAVEQWIERGELPEDVAWVLTKGKPYHFLVENLRPGVTRPTRPEAGVKPVSSPLLDGVADDATRPARDFAGAFRETFEQLDRRNGGTNFVKLADLRRALAGFDRDVFDLGLRALRLDGEFSLESHEGLLLSLTQEERAAGVREAGSLLVYVSRR